jgi:hypothetical protein
VSEKPKAIIFDIDGTVALRGDRDPYDMTKVGEDLPNEPVMLIAKMLAFAAGLSDIEILFFSGRDETAREQTQLWLGHHFCYDYKLYMRPAKDNGPDDELKRDFLEALSQTHDVVATFDDRNRVVDMWRANDITCFQVCSREQGDF